MIDGPEPRKSFSLSYKTTEKSHANLSVVYMFDWDHSGLDTVVNSEVRCEHVGSLVSGLGPVVILQQRGE